MSGQSLRLLRAAALWEEVLGAESGLGLLSSQDSGHIRGRLNLLGNGDSVMVTSCFHLCTSWSSSPNSPKTNTCI